MSPRITYKYLSPGSELTGEEFPRAEPIDIRYLEDVEEAAHREARNADATQASS